MLLKIGSVVVAGPSGPVMSVARIEGDHAYCDWFDRGANRVAKFPVRELKAATVYNLPRLAGGSASG